MQRPGGVLDRRLRPLQIGGKGPVGQSRPTGEAIQPMDGDRQFARQPRQLQLAYERLGHVENDLAMMKPRLTGTDAKGNPFVITADRAVQDAHNPKKATLTNLEADLALDKKSWLNARAKGGMVYMAAGKLELNGGIDVFTDTGYELHTASASMDLKQSIIHGHNPVTGQGPDGTMRADEFHADRATDLLVLSGHVRTTFTGMHK